MIIEFCKFHGAGNDFVIIDNRRGKYDLNSLQIKNICQRRFGVGADGVIKFNRSEKHDFELKYYNADGYEGTMCGNAGRCVVAFADYIGMQKRHYLFDAVDGLHRAEIIEKAGLLWLVSLTLIDVNGVETKGDHYYVDTGSPHHVEFVDNVEDYDVFNKGKIIRYSKDYLPEGTNVNFASFSDNAIYVRTYERGVEDETLACGTGATAVAIACAVLKNKNLRYYEIHARGGSLRVSFEKKGKYFTNIILNGPAELVFSGLINI